eukprot:767118-Hanusia_phi.AAC.3
MLSEPLGVGRARARAFGLMIGSDWPRRGRRATARPGPGRMPLSEPDHPPTTANQVWASCTGPRPCSGRLVVAMSAMAWRKAWTRTEVVML